jgi:hypothetical protein
MAPGFGVMKDGSNDVVIFEEKESEVWGLRNGRAEIAAANQPSRCQIGTFHTASPRFAFPVAGL